MSVRDVFQALVPFARSSSTGVLEVPQDQIVQQTGRKAKALKVKSLAVDQNHSFDRGRFESSPYDFNRIIQAIETDSFVNQALRKYRELIWKEGWDIVGESTEAVDYLYERMSFMEFAMRRPFEALLQEISDQLVMFNNAFVAKSRSNILPRGIANPVGNKELPIVGYYVIPAETVEIRRDRFNRPLAYRQRVETVLGVFDTTSNTPTWQADEVIHFTMDKKPGRAFGAPFLEPVLDDVIALRQIEEDIQNLIHKELHPLYLYRVGTETHPSTPEEIEQAHEEVNNLRSDGGLILPERHNVEVIGAESTALDASGYLNYFLHRVTAGLGISPHHLGILNEGGNRSVTDRLDIALYDKTKSIQRYMSDMIRLHIFTELLLEGGFDPISHPKMSNRSEHCEFRFREIDIDSKVKKENHTVNMYAQNVLGLDETRLLLGLDPDVDEDTLQQAVMTRSEPEPLPPMSSPNPSRPDAQRPSTGGRPNRRNTRKGPGNVVAPSNQYGRRTSPNIRHSLNEQWLDDVVSLLDSSKEVEKE